MAGFEKRDRVAGRSPCGLSVRCRTGYLVPLGSATALRTPSALARLPAAHGNRTLNPLTHKSRSHSPREVWHLCRVPLRAFVAIRNITAFLAGATLASMSLSNFVPFPKVGTLWRKNQHLQEKGQDYTLIYVGSSRVYHEFVAEQFDSVLESKGIKMKSLNFGQDGMWPPESFYVARQVLKERPPGLRWVLFDLMNIKGLLEGNETTLRSLYWHDLRHTRIALEHIFTQDIKGQKTWGEKIRLCWQHFTLWTQNATNAGAGSQHLRIWLKMEREKKPEPLKHHGWEPGGNEGLKGADLEQYQKELARLQGGVPPTSIPPVLRKELEALMEEIRQAGAEPVFVVASSIRGEERFSDWPPPGVKVIRFDDPAKYPQLYEPARRYDAHHLTPSGAMEFSRLLAEEFAKLVEAKK
jgi:hypothetical protein